MKTKLLWIIPVIVITGFISGCTPRSKYERMLKRELASGVRYDSLFMGLYFGMNEKEFYTHCWALNRQGLIRQGSRNMTVEYQIKKELKHLATMDFYPDFVEGKIAAMPVRFKYNGWAPWNNKLSSDSLQADILNWYEKQYGKGFMAVEHPERGIAYVKVNGNRRISIFKEDDLFVWAVFTDMRLINKLSDSANVMGNIQKDISRKLEKQDEK